MRDVTLQDDTKTAFRTMVGDHPEACSLVMTLAAEINPTTKVRAEQKLHAALEMYFTVKGVRHPAVEASHATYLLAGATDWHMHAKDWLLTNLDLI